MTKPDRELSEAELDMYLWGCVAQLLAYGLADAGGARAAFFRLWECEDAWRQVPLALENMKHAMPAIQAQTQLDDSLGKPPPRGGGGAS